MPIWGKIWGILALVLSTKAAAQYSNPVTDRFSLVGIIADSHGEKRNSSIAVVLDTQAKKNLVFRVGDLLPGYSSFKVLSIEQKSVMVGDYATKIELTHDSFGELTDSVASTSKSRNADDYEDGDGEYFGEDEGPERLPPQSYRSMPVEDIDEFGESIPPPPAPPRMPPPPPTPRNNGQDATSTYTQPANDGFFTDQKYSNGVTKLRRKMPARERTFRPE